MEKIVPMSTTEQRLSQILALIGSNPNTPAVLRLWELAAELYRQLDRPAFVFGAITIPSDRDQASECDEMAAHTEWMYDHLPLEVN